MLYLSLKILSPLIFQSYEEIHALRNTYLINIFCLCINYLKLLHTLNEINVHYFLKKI